MKDTSPRTWSQLASAAGLPPVQHSGFGDPVVVSLTDDSRKVREGACFVAVRGAVADGHAHVAEAVAAGASVVVIESGVPLKDLPRPVCVVRIADTKRALAKLAAAFYGVHRDARDAMLQIGVTGTNGKTTTAYLLRSILAAAGHTPAMLGTIEYDLVSRREPAPLTTPGAVELCRALSEARAAGATAAAMEVSSHALAQSRCDGLRFDAGIFTNLSGDHLDYHKTMDDYFAAKRRLFEMLDPGAAAIINADDPRAAALAEATPARVRTFGLDRRADVTAEIRRLDGTGSEFVVAGLGEHLPIRSRLIGAHNVMNILGAAAAAHAVGLPPAAIREGVERLRGVPGRLQRAEPDDCPFRVYVDYAHTDAALDNVLGVLTPLTAARLITVFGCGGDRDRTKRPRMARAAAQWSDLVVVTSDNPRTEDPLDIINDVLAGLAAPQRGLVQVEPDRRRAIEFALRQARAGDTVLIAGKGHEDYQIIGKEKRHFDDVEEAREVLSGMNLLRRAG